ncbi:hypothetical protein J0895_04785 [Phormidium pseudopriestleyi FRX01]|uniref:Glycosyltransferase RgtA/B/C/D-like domain-containing protein n=1 Tax=Phormidium pseudopriestleyi FRX01 TaxID=1759528 RepID=A0ABS3FMU4_9CYAN|nr:hypothetical protein [Phormidium pseudopriestleyi]MBO0348430.1 hypothetical protein [Phormidium pseudopriestleyi FRX01]
MNNLRKFLTAPISHRFSPIVIFWFSLSLTFATIYGGMVLQKAFSVEYMVQDDARQHVFWMQRFVNPDLFPGDYIADYFQSVAPVGYTAVYRGMALLGIEPLLLSKLLPIALVIITTIYCFGLTLQLFPVPLAGFISSVLLNQSLWMKFDVVSATPRAFLYPIFVAFLYYLSRNQLVGSCVAIALLGLFYPQYVFIGSGILLLRLVSWQSRRISLSRNWRDYLFSGIGLAVAFAVMLPYALKTNEYGPVLTAADAMNSPELWPGGRNPFYHENPFYFWLIGERSGILPPLLPPLIWMGIFLPWVCRYPSRFPLVSQISPAFQLLRNLILAAILMFFAAHSVLFRLHLPSRYIDHSFRIVLAVVTGILITILIDWALGVLTPFLGQFHQFIAAGMMLFFTAALIFYPNYTPSFPRTNYRPGPLPDLYQFFQQQPQDILIASLSGEANNLPTFSHRSILVGREYAIPYHQGYYREFSQRMRDVIRAQYSGDMAIVQGVIEQYGIDFWLIEQSAFEPGYFARNRWLQQYQPEADEAIASLESGNLPFVAQAIARCTVFNTGDFLVLQSQCMIND